MRLFLYILLFFQLNLFASSFKNGGVFFKNTSPFSIQQTQDSISKKKYAEIKALVKENNYSKALEQSLMLLETARKSKDIQLEILCVSTIGDLFNRLKNHDKAIKYLKLAITLIQQKEDVYFNDKMIFYDKSYSKNKILSANYLRLGAEYLSVKKRDSAKYFFLKIVDLVDLPNELQGAKASAYNNLSAMNIQDKLYVKAREYSIKALEIRRRTNNKLFEASAMSNLASIYLLEKNYKKAKEVYQKAIKLIEYDESKTAYTYKQSLYFNLAWTLYLLKDYTAYEYQELSYEIKDSLRSQNFEHVVKGVFEKHQIELEKEKVALAKQKVALTKAEERRTNWFLTALMVLVLGISGFTLYTYKLRQRNLRLKLEQTEFTQKSKLDKIKSESQIRILNATLDGKETERKQIAETLHDSVSSLLSSANLHLQATKMQFNGDTPIEIDKTQKIIIEASQKIRDLSHTLVSSVLLKFGLKYAIKDMAEKYSNSQINIETNIKGVRRYHQSFEIKVNNIIQEFVNNILKHSNATKAIVRIEDRDGLLHINIQDDGVGFDKKEIPKKDGLGINQIDARIQMMKGKFHINSSPETGTIIEIELPIQEKETTVSV